MFIAVREGWTSQDGVLATEPLGHTAMLDQRRGQQIVELLPGSATSTRSLP